MIKLEIDVYRTLGKLGIVDYDIASVVSEVSSGKGVELEVYTNNGAVFNIIVATSDIVFVVDHYTIMKKALEQFTEDNSLEKFNKLLSAGKDYFNNRKV